MQYIVNKKYYDGLSIIGYGLKSLDGKVERTLKVEDTIKLARDKQITNARAFYDSSCGSYVLYVLDGLANLEVVEKSSKLRLNLICRLVETFEGGEKHCIGYVAKDETNKSHKISIQKAWELAKAGCINGVEASMLGDKRTLLSLDGKFLATLPIM